MGEFRVGVGAEAGDDAVVEEDEGDYGDEVGEEEAGPAEGVDGGGEDPAEEWQGGDDEEGAGGEAGDLEDGYALLAGDGVGEDLGGGGGVEVVEGGEDGAEALEFRWYLGGIYWTLCVCDGAGFGVGAGLGRCGGITGDGIACGAGAFKGLEVGVAVGEADLEWGLAGLVEFADEAGPGASCSGAEVEDGGGVGGAEGGGEGGEDGFIRIAEVPKGFKRVGDEVAQEGGEAGVVVDFGEVAVGHESWMQVLDASGGCKWGIQVGDTGRGW